MDLRLCILPKQWESIIPLDLIGPVVRGSSIIFGLVCFQCRRTHLPLMGDRMDWVHYELLVAISDVMHELRTNGFSHRVVDMLGGAFVTGRSRVASYIILDL